MYPTTICYLLLYCSHILYATRIPMKTIDIQSSSQVAAAAASSNYNKDLFLETYSKQSIHSRHGRQIEEIPKPRIIYQVGDSEEDLPICEPKQVCSKIDLYGLPWLERHCRCPKYEPLKHIITYLHNNNDIYFTEPFGKKVEKKDIIENSSIEKERQHYIKIVPQDQQQQQLQRPNANNEFKKIFRYTRSNDIITVHKNNNHMYRNRNKNYYHHLQQQQQQQQQPKFSNNRNHEMKKLRHHGHGRGNGNGINANTKMNSDCSSTIDVKDGYTIFDKTRQYKLCNPISELRECGYFEDFTWTIKTYPDKNFTEQIIHCICPKNSITYLHLKEPVEKNKQPITYSFACSPQSHLRCELNSPCKLFTIRKRPDGMNEVNTNSLCQCPKHYRCPKHHSEASFSGHYSQDSNVVTYSGFCIAE